MINLKHNNTTVSKKENLANASQTERFLDLLKRHFYIYSLQRDTKLAIEAKFYQRFLRNLTVDTTYDSKTIIELTRKAYLIKTISCKPKNYFTTKAIFLQHNQQENIEQKM